MLHYTLSWHADDQPAADDMKRAALASLKVMGLQDHEAVIAAHRDKTHLHVHIVVNTVNPETGLTAPMKFSKLELSKWAEGYEMLHQVRCEERVRNNAERARLKSERQAEAEKILLSVAEKKPLPQRLPYAPVKHKQVSRQVWLDRKDITERMKTLRASIESRVREERDATWQRQLKERDALDTRKDHALSKAREAAREQNRPLWRALYRSHYIERRRVERLAGNPFERAVYVFQHRDELGAKGGKATAREMVSLIRSQRRLEDRIAHKQTRDRQALSRQSRYAERMATEEIARTYRAQATALFTRHTEEREAARQSAAEQRRTVSFAMAKATLLSEREAPTRDFKRAPPDRPQQGADLADPFARAAAEESPRPPTRSDALRAEMEAWRARNPGHDFGQEL